MDDQEQLQNASQSEIKARWESGESIALTDVARAYGVSYTDAWGILQGLGKQDQGKAA